MFHNIEFRNLNLVNNILYAYVLLYPLLSDNDVNDGIIRHLHILRMICDAKSIISIVLITHKPKRNLSYLNIFLIFDYVFQCHRINVVSLFNFNCCVLKIIFFLFELD